MAPVTITTDEIPCWLVDGRAMPVIAGGAPTVEELEQRQRDIQARLQQIDAEYAGQTMPEEARGEWNELNQELDRNEELIGELNARAARLAELAGDPEHTEVQRFETARPGATRGADIWDMASIRRQAITPEAEARELRDRSLRAIESSVFPHEHARQEDVQSHVERLLDRFSGEEFDGSLQVFARRILTTGSPTYRRAFSKSLAGRPLTADEQRAMSLSGSAGGYAVPYQLDPTIVPTSNSSVNPYRAIARVEPITGDEWRGVTSGAITAAYAAEGTEATDNSPTLAQPTISAERAQAFVPFSIELGQDWGAMQAEMAMLLQDAKDDLEASKFTTGGGTNEPFGVLTGATTTVAAGGTAAFASTDLDAVEVALPPRFRPRAQWVANRAVYQLVRHFDTAGGADLWVRIGQGLANQVPTPGNIGAELLGYPANECSTMAAALTTGNKIAILGDWRYFVIVERIGMNIDLIPHLFGGTANYPTGQRGLYAFWRNSSKVLSAAAFRVLVTG